MPQGAARRRCRMSCQETVSALRAGLAAYIDFYNTRRPHFRGGLLRYPADIQAGSLSRLNTGYPLRLAFVASDAAAGDNPALHHGTRTRGPST